MSKVKVTMAIAVFAGLAGVLGVLSFAGEDERTLLQKADALYEKHHYKEALESYEAALAASPSFEGRPLAGMRTFLCLYHLRRWDDASARAETYMKEHQGTVWEARCARGLANLLARQPHYTYKAKTGVVTRGKYVRGGYYTNTSATDHKNARKYFELSKALYYVLVDREGSNTEKLRAEIMKLNFDLAKFLSSFYSSRSLRGMRKEEKEVKTHYQGGRYSPSWPTRVKIQALYDEIAGLDTGEHKKATALAIYRKASFFRANKHRRAENEPLALFRSIIKRFPKDELAPDALFTVARHLDNAKNYLLAKTEYERLIKEYPDTKWVVDCRHYLTEMARPRISVNASGIRLPGGKIKIKVTSRNIDELDFKAFPVLLDKIFSDPRNLDRSRRDFFQRFLSFGGAQEHREIQVAEWSAKTNALPDHGYVNQEVDVPNLGTGAFVIQARGKTAVFESVLVISDLAVVKKMDNRRLIAFVVDAVTGRPVAGAKVFVKERFWQNRVYQVNLYDGKTGPDGVYVQPMSGSSTKYVQVFAGQGQRYAATGMSYWRFSSRSNLRARIYTYTDRPVYRPGHTVHFRSLVKRVVQGEYKAAAKELFLVTIYDARRKKLLEQRMETDAFGALHGKLLLDKKARLGQYRIDIRSHRKERFSQSGGNRFRVEEYKKPEFKVTVESGGTQAKAGERIKVKISAQYYFGAPVAEAEVSYRIHRENYRHSFVPSGEYDWLYGRGYGWRPWWSWYRRRPKAAKELVLEGRGKTDAEGNLYVEIDTAKAVKELPDTDHRYSIEAEVRDKSRRTIEGSGSVKVTRTAYYAFLTANRGFYQAGERAEFKVITQDADGRPVAAVGKIEVYELLPKKAAPPDGKEEGAKYEERLLLSDSFKTSSVGVGFYKWVSDSVGRFAIVFRAPDAWGGEVMGREEVWTVGDKFEGWRFRFADVEILTDRRSYEEGDTVRVMVNTDNAGAHVLLTCEANNEILTYQILDMSKKSMVFDLPLGKAHVPNFFLRAVSFHGGKPFAANREILVPPANRFLNVTMTPDKEKYRPGEEALFVLTVKDRRGKPVSTELSLGVIDASVLYIQSEYRPDVRKYYYGSKRSMRTRMANSLSLTFRSYFSDSAFYEKVKLHGYPMGWRGRAWARHGKLGNDRLRQDASIEESEGGLDKGGMDPESSKKSKRRSRASGGGARPTGSPTPTPTPAPSARGKSLESKEMLDREGGPGKVKKAQVRRNFADTANWTPGIHTDDQGRAEVRFTFPDSLTTWKATAVGSDAGGCVGNVIIERVTRKDLMVRLQAPRFFIERDEVVLSGVVNNYLSSQKKVKVRLTMGGGALKAKGALETWVDVPANGETRVDFEVTAIAPGQAEVTIEALTDEESDAMALTFPVYVHGVQKDVTVSGVLREKRRAVVRLRVPKDRNPAATEFRLTVSPSMASGLLESLPYLIEYPYGCVEQTTSRFLPAVVVRRTLKDLGIDLETIALKRKDESARHLAGRILSRRRLGRVPTDPVFNTAELDRIVEAGLQRLYSFQRSDGSFGWWRHGPVNVYMTSYVLYGLLEAKAAGYAVDKERLTRSESFLRRFFPEEKSLARRSYIAWVLSRTPEKVGQAERDLLWKNRDDLNHYLKSLLALTLWNCGDRERAATVVGNVAQFVSRDNENGTCHLEESGSRWWYWYNDGIEANAFFLRALLRVQPKSELIPMLVKWLVTNRRGSRWKSTKDTANCVYALMEYVRAEDELNPEYSVTVKWPGVGEKEFHVTRENVFTFDNMFLRGGEGVPDGDHEVEIVVDGKGTLYFTAHLSYFTKEVGIKASGHELFVNREYFRVQRVKRQERRGGRDVTVLDWKRTKLVEGDILKSGERIEVRLNIEAKNLYEYLVFEDPKPAGCETVALRSGYSYGNLCSNMELRDEKVVFFVGTLEQGKHAITYQMRAEVPGRFHALPTQAYAMYAPRVKGISDEWIMTIVD